MLSLNTDSTFIEAKNVIQNKSRDVKKEYSTLVLSILISIGGLNYVHPEKILAYDLFADICNQREERQAALDRRINQMDFQATDIPTIKNNLSLIKADYLKDRGAYKKNNSIKYLNYAEYIKNILKIIGPSLDKDMLNEYIKLRENLMVLIN